MPIEQEDVEAGEVILSEETIAVAAQPVASTSFAVASTSSAASIPSSSKRIRSPLPILETTGPSITPTNGGFNGLSRNLFFKCI